MSKKAEEITEKTILSPKRERFCLEYVKDSNGTQSAIRAGYSSKTAQEQSSRLLSNVMIQGRLKELQEEIEEDCKRDPKELITLLWKIADEEQNHFKLIAIKQLTDIYGITAAHKLKREELDIKWQQVEPDKPEERPPSEDEEINNIIEENS